MNNTSTELLTESSTELSRLRVELGKHDDDLKPSTICMHLKTVKVLKMHNLFTATGEIDTEEAQRITNLESASRILQEAGL